MTLHINSDEYYGPAVERCVRNCIDNIERLHGKLVGCQVLIRVGHALGHYDARPVDIKVHLTLPGHTLCVNTAQSATPLRFDVRAALQDAFAMLQQRLLEQDHEQVAALQRWG